MNALVISALLSVHASFDSAAVSFDEISNVGCPTKEGGFAYDARRGRYSLVVFTDSLGTPTHVYRLEDECTDDARKSRRCNQSVDSAVKSLWEKAEPADTSRVKRNTNCARSGWGWESNNPTPYDEEVFADGAEVRIDVKNLRFVLRAETTEGEVKGCKDLRMYAVLGESKVLLAEDRCRPGEQTYGLAQWNCENAVAPGEDRIALSLLAYRSRSDKTTGEISRGRLVVVDRKTIATVDLLDAGAGASLEALAAKVRESGFRIAHRGKGQKSRVTTNVYFAKGFEAEARELAKALGVPEGAVEPRSWKSPYAITVAAGAK